MPPEPVLVWLGLADPLRNAAGVGFLAGLTQGRPAANPRLCYEVPLGLFGATIDDLNQRSHSFAEASAFIKRDSALGPSFKGIAWRGAFCVVLPT